MFHWLILSLQMSSSASPDRSTFLVPDFRQPTQLSGEALDEQWATLVRANRRRVARAGEMPRLLATCLVQQARHCVDLVFHAAHTLRVSAEVRYRALALFDRLAMHIL